MSIKSAGIKQICILIFVAGIFSAHHAIAQEDVFIGGIFDLTSPAGTFGEMTNVMVSFWQ